MRLFLRHRNLFANFLVRVDHVIVKAPKLEKL